MLTHKGNSTIAIRPIPWWSGIWTCLAIQPLLPESDPRTSTWN